MTAASLTRILHTRSVMMVTALIAMACTLAAYIYLPTELPFSTVGFVSKWSGDWHIHRALSLGGEMLLNACIIMMIVHINKIYNLLRSLTQLQGTLFLLMQIATPTLLLCLCPGTLMCAVVVLCTWIMFRLYGADYIDTRKIFLVFTLLSACTSFDIYYVIYIPVFVISCLQMRVMCLRTISAILLGLFTPWIIFFGFGLISPNDLQLPDAQLFIRQISTPSASVLVVTAILTCFLTVGALLQNMIKILTYNAMSRSLLSVVTTLTVVTLLATIINSANIFYYLPLLNCCCALQLAHLFGAIHTFAKSYIAILSIAGLYLLILAWKIVIHFFNLM